MEDVNILQLGIEHPARTIPFEDLVKGLYAEVAKGNINVNSHPLYPELVIFKYTPQCTYEKQWNVFTMIARGLVLDLKERKVVATPFIKFFNYGEVNNSSIDFKSEFTAHEKMDGSLGIVFFAKDQWMTATGGSFASEQAIWGNKWLHSHVNMEAMDCTNTYLFEIIYPENKIVVNYDFSGLVLLSIFNNFGIEYPMDSLPKEADFLRVRCANIYDFKNIDDVISNAKGLDFNSEGYVIRFKKDGYRLKIKGDEYVRIHRIVSGVTPLAIWEAMKNKIDYTDVRKEMPEEIQKDFDQILSILNNQYDSFINEVKFLYESTKSFSDKELGLLLQKRESSLFDKCKHPESKYFIFSMRKILATPEKDMDVLRSKVFMIIRPKNNKIEGYVPSSVANRFSEDF